MSWCRGGAAIAMVLLLPGCGATGNPHVLRSIENRRLGVVVSAVRLPPRVAVSTVRPAPPPLRRLKRASRTFRVGPSGPLAYPTIIRIPLLQRAPRGSTIVVATSEQIGAPTSFLRARLVSRNAVVVHVHHLSLFTAFWVNARSLLASLRTEILDGLASNVVAEARPPTCLDERAARDDGYTIESSNKTTVYWCFGIENGRRVLRVVNNRRYPLAVRHPGVAVVDSGPRSVALEQLSRASSGRDTIIFPRNSAVFGVDLPPDTHTYIRTELDGVGVSLYQLQEGISAAATVLSRAGLLARGAGLTLKTALESQECATAIGETGGDVLKKCIPPLLQSAYGPRAVLAEAVLSVGSLAAFLRSEWNAAFDQINGRDSYVIGIGRAATTTGEASAPPVTTPAPSAVTTAPATAATVQPSESAAIGQRFSDDCQVAWPTAPTRTSQYIEMTMQCVHLPKPYLLAAVIYGDPNLAVTPSTGRVHVEGTVVDVATSGLGFRELVVRADRIDLP
ncbi:MAG: hypothetical protein ACJ76I_15770 [Gaiellaceae bacterium]